MITLAHSHLFNFLYYPPQEVTDEQGRRRFHGAFTGGFSAGYFNSVGSAEGWAPSTFRSSRSDRNSAKQQNVEQFLDDDELDELKRTNLQTNATYDTFGDTAAETTRRAMEDESRRRPSAIPGLLPDEAVAPVAEGIGIQLLQRMGWRQGKGIGAAGAARQQEGSISRWGTVAGVGPENTPLHLITPKHDVYGLGYDPFRGAEEFRIAQERRTEAARPSRGRGPGSSAGADRGGRPLRQRGVAFGSGVLDEDDSYGILEDYVTHDDVESYEEAAGMDNEGMPIGRGPRVERTGLGDRLAIQGFAYEIQDAEESDDDEGLYLGHPGKKQRPLQLTGPAAPLMLHSAQHAKHKSLIPGFVLASGDAMQRPAFFPPPQIPADYIPVHRQPPPPPPAAATTTPSGKSPQVVALGAPGGTLQQERFSLIFPLPAGPAVPPPQDVKLRQEIEQLAFFVAKNGPSFENLAKEQQTKAATSGAKSSMFLLGGEGAAFYAWKLATLRALLAPKGKNIKQVLAPIGQRSVPLSAEDRGALLGEVPLKPSIAAPQHAQQKSKPAIPLARSLLNVAEQDRKRLATALGSTFVRAEAEGRHQSEYSDDVQAGLRPGVAPVPTIPTPLDHSVNKPLQTGGMLPATSAGISAPNQQPRGIITVQDLSRPRLDLGGIYPGVSTLPPTAGSAALPPPPSLPVRKSEEWRPEPLLCKRLDVPDPFKGRPREIQMSRFKTDHLALPATAEAMSRAAAAVAPSAPEFLIPPSVRVAAEEAAAAAQLAAVLMPPPRAPLVPPSSSAGGGQLFNNREVEAEGDVDDDDASGAAEAFLSSVFGAPERSNDQLSQEQGAAGAAAEAKVLAEIATIEKPVDLFKAIFDDSSESEPETEDVNKVEGKAGIAGGPSEHEKTYLPSHESAPLGQTKGMDKDKDKIAGFEKFKREYSRDVRDASARHGPYSPKSEGDFAGNKHQYQNKEGGIIEKDDGGGASGEKGIDGLDPEVRNRVEAALRVLKEAKKSKKRKKERRSDKER